MKYELLSNADSAVTVQFEKEISEKVNGLVTSLCAELEIAKINGVTELLPTFTSLTVYYDCTVISAKKLTRILKKHISKIGSSDKKSATVYYIPVCYESEYGEDLKNVCEHTGLTTKEVIELHTGKNYLIYMLGFLPGFAYLGGMDKRLATPRLKTPRTAIPEGAVGIGGEQTGIYPVRSPGGWQLIGRTPVKVYNKDDNSILYNAGDYIRFFSITKEDYDKIKSDVENGTYTVKSEEVQV